MSQKITKLTLLTRQDSNARYRYYPGPAQNPARSAERLSAECNGLGLRFAHQWNGTPAIRFGFGGFAAAEQKRAVTALKEALEESRLPFRVDLFVWDEIPAQFRENIQQAHVVLVNARSS